MATINRLGIKIPKRQNTQPSVQPRQEVFIRRNGEFKRFSEEIYSTHVSYLQSEWGWSQSNSQSLLIGQIAKAHAWSQSPPQKNFRSGITGEMMYLRWLADPKWWTSDVMDG